MSKPDFVDNQGGNILAKALKEHLQSRFSTEREVKLDIATEVVDTIVSTAIW